ncbi:MAG: transglutaminase [Phycisphaeraceae bacterium]|nr:transglutaminase [Phycisphaeraceae bacterium]|tara:strand:- start:8 stop:880 length:873 start_codon:yes stop_codon:yes gene_type:complete
MRYTIRHTTRYSYDRPVYLQPSVIRLRPQTNGWQTLEQSHLNINPTPAGQSLVTDLGSNTHLYVWFPAERALDYLAIVSTSTVNCHRDNPFDYVLDSRFNGQLPAYYPSQMQDVLQPALTRDQPDTEITELANQWSIEAKHDVHAFLTLINQRLATDIMQVVRMDGLPQSPAQTWQSRQGACRDLAVLTIDLCRAMGLAARFVSGYVHGFLQEGRTELHAWMEVYLPGGGWRGYDPTMGLAVTNRHIVLATSPNHMLAAPFTGTFSGPNVTPHLMYDIAITPMDEDEPDK